MNLEIPFKKTSNQLRKIYINLELREHSNFLTIEKMLENSGVYNCRFPSLTNKSILKIIITEEDYNEKFKQLLNMIIFNFVKSMKIRFDQIKSLP